MVQPLQKIMRYLAKHGIVRPRDIEAIGLPREYLVRLHRQVPSERDDAGKCTEGPWLYSRRNRRIAWRFSTPSLTMERGHRLVQETVATRAFELFGEPTLLPLNPSRREDETKLADELGAMGYPGFAYLAETPTRNPAELLLDALDRPDLATRVAEGLLWVSLRYSDLDWTWLLSEMKLRNRQNRLGFVAGLALQLVQRLPGRNEVKSKLDAVELELEKARLANPGTYCHDSWSKGQREQTDMRRSDLAKHWNLTTGVRLEHLEHYSS